MTDLEGKKRLPISRRHCIPNCNSTAPSILLNIHIQKTAQMLRDGTDVIALASQRTCMKTRIYCCVGWPISPSQETWCHACPAGWAAAVADQKFCSMCTPGTYAQVPRSPACLQCSNGTYANSWGSSHCNHCIIGTFAPYKVPSRTPHTLQISSEQSWMYAHSHPVS